ncbi:matrixin family metalloprotease [Lactobacillus sp. CRM56-3]|uniref:Matrixin family metalloprotease n=2 Tax=Secundilactobacillus folii TaxID=2678357 RepID=A0A7X3C2E8_9LACO|nr:matrixin family metalloprotease [Secundilactobacillus folii]
MSVDNKPSPVDLRAAVSNVVKTVDPMLKTTTHRTVKSETSADETPIESIVQGQNLSRTYYYHFDSNVPASAQAVFENAVNVYNQTGLVKLIAGEGTSKQNSVTFFVYSKKTSGSNNSSVMIESGHGGPQITQQTGWGAYTANHARAGLNVYYPRLAIKQSVAIHELGHALGLDHSTSRQSVMYPVDQGVTKLSQGDIEALKAIYGSGEKSNS